MRSEVWRVAPQVRSHRAALSYPEDMTGLLEQAVRRMESLSAGEQDAIASQIIETLDDEDAWARSFHENPRRCDPWRMKPRRSIVEARPARWTN